MIMKAKVIVHTPSPFILYSKCYVFDIWSNCTKEMKVKTKQQTTYFPPQYTHNTLTRKVTSNNFKHNTLFRYRTVWIL